MDDTLSSDYYSYEPTVADTSARYERLVEYLQDLDNDRRLERLRFRSKMLKISTIVVVGVLAGYAIVSALVRATAGEQVTENRRVMPFTETSLGTYDKDIDDHLKLITATISLQLEKLCDTEGADMSWESLQAILAQCPVLEPDQERVYGEETYSGKFSKVDVNTWLYDFINKHDSDVRDAARIHDQKYVRSLSLSEIRLLVLISFRRPFLNLPT